MLISISLQCRRAGLGSHSITQVISARVICISFMRADRGADVEDRNGNIQWDVDRKYRSFCKREFCLCNISAFRSISVRSLVSNEYLMMAEALSIGKLSIISIFGTVCFDAAPYFRSKS